jgi:hypothetical protein
MPSQYTRPHYVCATCYKYINEKEHWSYGLPHCLEECAQKTKERWDKIMEDIENKRDRR